MGKYQYIEEYFKSKIISKEYKLGDRLPSESQICEQFNVSRITAKRALDELEHNGYIKRVKGSGNYVSYKPINHLLTGFYSLYDEIQKMGRKPSSKVLVAKEMPITQVDFSADARNQLLLYEYDKVFFLKRLRYADDEILALDYTYIPIKYAPSLQARLFSDPEVSLFSVLKDRFDLMPDRAQESFGVCSVSKSDANHLEVTPHSPALINTRVSFYHGIPIEYNHRICKGESYRYIVNLEMR